MIGFGKVEISNFLSIENASIDFSNRGLLAILGPNGAGKSSLIVDSLLYGLFGLTEKYGNERDQIVNRFVGKDCHIYIPMDIDSGDEIIKVEIDAYRKHYKYKDEVFLKINGKDSRGRTNSHTWDKVAKLMDMDYVSFTNSVVFGQSTAQFSSLSDANQKSVIERLLGLSWIPRAYELAIKDRDEVSQELNTILGNYENFQKKMVEIDTDLKFYLEKHSNFEYERIQKIKELETEFLELKDISELEKKIKKLETEAKVLEQKLGKKKDIEDTIKNLDLGIRELEVKLRLKEGEIKKIEKRIADIGKIENGERCEYCGQVITILSTNSYLVHLSGDIKNLKDEANQFDLLASALSDDKAPVEKQHKRLLEIEKEVKTVLQEIESQKRNLSSFQVMNAKIEEKNNSVRQRIEEAKEQKNSFKDIITKFEDSKKAILIDVNDLLDKCNIMAEEKKYKEFQVELYSNRGFKSFVIESVLPDMDRFASIYSRALGGKYDISFSPQSVLKKGEVREKFNVNVANRYGATVYEGNSSGEKRAVDSIVMFCLGDLAASRLNKRISLLILDDIFEKLDDETCKAIVKVLRMMVTPKEVREEEFRDLPKKESIFVLTHLEQFKESFENKIMVNR